MTISNFRAHAAGQRLTVFGVSALAVAALLGGCTTVERSTADSVSAAHSADTTSGVGSEGERADGTVADTAAARWTVLPDGVGGIRVGMTTAQVRTALGIASAPPFAAGSCSYLDVATMPKRLYVMAESDTVVRVDVRDSTLSTAEGARIGDTEERIKSLYGARVRVEPHKYTGPAGHYLKVSVPGDTSRLIVFETDGQRVTTYRVGRRPAVEYVEGCS